MKNYISGGIEYDWKTGRPVEGSTVYDQSTQVKTLKPEIQGSIDAANANALNQSLYKGSGICKVSASWWNIKISPRSVNWVN